MPSDREVGDVPLDDVELRMRPGRFSQAGFLGADERLLDVLSSDAAALAELGLTAGELASPLRALLAAALETRQSRTRIGAYDLRIRRYKGPQICPFAREPHEQPCPAGVDMRLASIDWQIVEARRRVDVSGPGLIVHLIDAHSFFEGPGSPYRVAPRTLAELLGLGPFAR